MVAHPGPPCRSWRGGKVVAMGGNDDERDVEIVCVIHASAESPRLCKSSLELHIPELPQRGPQEKSKQTNKQTNKQTKEPDSRQEARFLFPSSSNGTFLVRLLALP